MRLKPETLAMTVVLGLLTAVGPLSTDFYLPSLPEIGRVFSVPASRVQLTLSVFLIGFAVGQIVYGPVSDRYGRKPALVASLLLFLAGTGLCAFAWSIEALIGARFLQAVGASGSIVLARAIVRDLYEGPRAGQEMSRMGTIMGLVPAVAPVLGGALQATFGWRSTFVVTLALALALLVIVVVLLPETNRIRSAVPISPSAILRGFGMLLRHPGYRVYVGLVSLAYAGLFSFISASSFVLQGAYGLSEIGFGLAFSACVIGFITGTLLATRLVRRRGLDSVIAIGVTCLGAGSLLMLVAVIMGPQLYDVRSPLEIVLPMMLYLVGVGLTMPQAIAAAMTPFPDRAGAASSFLGMTQMLFSALVGAVVGHALGSSIWPLPLAMTLTGVGAAALFFGSHRVRAG